MDFKKIRQVVKEVQLDTLRLDEEDNFEAVVLKEQVAKLTQRLESFFGKPVFPSNDKLPTQILQTIDAFGGIMPGQTLYYWGQGKDAIFAMLWSWSDGKHITVKIIKK